MRLVFWAGTALACTAPNPAYHADEVVDAGVRADAGARDAPAGKRDAAPTTPDAALPAEVAASIDSRLLGYWPLDEAAGATAATDRSGHGRDGVVEGQGQGLTFVGSGHSRGALSVPGGSSAAVGVRIPYSTEIDDLRAFTIAAWFRLTAVPGVAEQRSVISRQLGTTTGELFNLTCVNGDIVVYIPGSGGQINFEARAKGAALAGVWTHAAATYDGRYLRLYINGSQAAVSDFPDRLVTSPSNPVYIGTNKNTNNSEPFNGLIDDVALYSYALSASAVSRLAEGASPIDVR